MKVIFDPIANAAYIYLSINSQRKISYTYTCDPSVINGQINLDFDVLGHLIGIEVLDARQLLSEDLLNISENKQ